MRLLKSIDPEDSGMTQLGFFKKGDYGKNLLRTKTPIANFTKRDGLAVLNEDTLLKADQIIDDLEAFHDRGIAGSIPKWTDKRPTSQYRGSRRLPYTNQMAAPVNYILTGLLHKKTLCS